MWGVVQSKALQERKAAEHVAAASFDTYTPRYFDSELRRERVLFPRYFFARKDEWTSLRGVRGVCGVLLPIGDSAGDRLATGVEWLRSQEDDNGLIVLSKPAPRRLCSGDMVEIVRGPFEGQFGIYDGMAAGARIRVLMTMLGSQRLIVVGEGDVVAEAA